MRVVNRNMAESDDGYSVRQTASLPPIFLYIEGDHALEFSGFPSLDDRNRYSLWVSTNTVVAWLPPHDREVISSEKRAQIVERIRGALDVLDHNPTIRHPEPPTIRRTDERTVTEPGCFEIVKVSDQALVYRAAGRSMVIPYVNDEAGLGALRISYASMQSWSPPNQGDLVTLSDVMQMSQNLMRALPLLGHPSVLFEKP